MKSGSTRAVADITQIGQRWCCGQGCYWRQRFALVSMKLRVLWRTAVTWTFVWVVMVRSAGAEWSTFDGKQCDRFDKLLERHLRRSRSLREESERLGVAALSTFFMPVVPYPLAIMSVVRSRQAETRSLSELRLMGVTDANWEGISRQCAALANGGEVRFVRRLNEPNKIGGLGASGVAFACAGIALIYASALHVLVFCYLCCDVEVILKR